MIQRKVVVARFRRRTAHQDKICTALGISCLQDSESLGHNSGSSSFTAGREPVGISDEQFCLCPNCDWIRSTKYIQKISAHVRFLLLIKTNFIQDTMSRRGCLEGRTHLFNDFYAGLQNNNGHWSKFLCGSTLWSAHCTSDWNTSFNSVILPSSAHIHNYCSQLRCCVT